MTIWRDRGKVDPQEYLRLGLPARQLEDEVTKRKVFAWLARAVVAGTQIPDVAGLQKGFHYRGDGPWYPEVQAAIIVSLFMRASNTEELSTAQFMKALRSVAGNKKTRTVQRLVPFRNSRGELHLRPRVSFIKFSPIEQYKEVVRDVDSD